MIRLIKLDIKNNKGILLGLVIFTISFVFLLKSSFYDIDIYNFQLNEDKLTNNNTRMIKWLEIFYPAIFAGYLAKFFSDSFSSSSLAFSLTLPISLYRQVFLRIFLWLGIFSILMSYPLRIFENKIIGTIGPDYLPIGGIFLYTLSNTFILSSYLIFIQILLREFYFSLGFLVAYVLFDYFAEGRYLKDLSLHSYAFKDYKTLEFIRQKTFLICFGFFLLFIAYMVLSKSKTYRKAI